MPIAASIDIMNTQKVARICGVLFLVGLIFWDIFFVRDAVAVVETSFVDVDHDGYSVDGSLGGKKDCNDTNKNISPAARELCDGIDNNCDGSIDEGLTMTTYYQDVDFDSYGSITVSKSSCRAVPGYVTNAKDCNDNDPKISPAIREVCDGIDNNCSGAIDEGLPIRTYYRDSDSDTYGNATASKSSCRAVSGYVARAKDCNDSDKNISPAVSETCDGIDSNCNGSVDDGLPVVTYYQDADGDTYGNASNSQSSCKAVSGYVADATDCNDADKTISPGASETCDSLDNNCSGTIDEDLPTTTSYQDSDGDSYGDPDHALVSCSTSTITPVGYVPSGGDCNDGDKAVSPATSEICDSIDNNCDGTVDEGLTTIYYADADGDGYGDATSAISSCAPVSGYVTDNSDTDDAHNDTVTADAEAAGEAEVTLATDGSPELDIHYADTASDATITAATELKTYLDKITGGRFTLSEISAADAEVEGATGIFVGTADDFPSMPDTDRLVVNADDPTTKEAFAINSLTDQVWLGGATDVAVQHAVTRLLDELGCRWFFQGPTWEVIPSTPTLTFSGSIFDQPKMAYRFLQGIGFHDSLDEDGNSQCAADETDWYRHNHLAYRNSAGTAWTGVALPLVLSQKWDDAIPEINTYQDNFLNFGESSPPDDNLHPDPDNRYGWLTSNQQHRTLELANSLVRDAYKTWLRDRWVPVYDPKGISFPIEPGDGAATAISESKSALSIDSACAPSCTDSDMMVTLANDISSWARSSGDSSLDQRYVTFLGGYGHLAPPTLSLTPHTAYVNVFPVQTASVGEYTTTTALLDGWAAKGAGLSIYHCISYFIDRNLIGSNYSQSFDGQSPDYASDTATLSADIKSYVEHKLTGAAYEISDNFGYHGPAYYVLARLLWDANADKDALLDDFYDKAYGPAKENMRKYHDLLDPMGQPQLISKDFMAQAYAYLAAAANDATAEPAVIARINDLKTYLHHNALWWQIYRAEHNSEAQKQLMRDLISLNYRTRSAYMTAWEDDISSILPGAAQQFADDSANWSITDTSASWRAVDTYPTQEEIDAWFAADTAYFTPDPVTQLTWTGQPEAVSDFTGTQGAPSMSNGSNGKPFTLALYTPTGETSLTLGFNVGQFNTTSSPASPLTVTLTDAAGTSYGTQTVNPGTYGSSAYQDVTFSDLPEKTGFTAAVNPFGSRVYVRGSTASRIDSPMAWQLDKIARTDGMSSPVANGYYFYVPKGTTEIQYYWNRLSNTSTDNPIAIPFSGKGCYKDTTVSWTAVTTDNDGTQTHCLLAPDGTITTVNDFQQVIKVPVTSGNDGKVWQIILNSHGASAKQLWFYNVPPYVADSPTSLVIPHDLVVTDGLTPR